MISTMVEIDRPFRVVLVGGKDSDMISGHVEEDGATARCAIANAQAQALGISARYEVRNVKGRVTREPGVGGTQ